MEHMESHVTSTYTTETTAAKKPVPSATLYAFAVVGFISLILIGITLAIYSAQFIPTLVSKLGTGVGTSTSTSSSSLSVVSATSTEYTQTVIGIPTNPVNPAAQLPGVVVPPSTNPEPSAPTYHAPYGLSDLSTTIIATGYLTGDSTDTFVPARIIPPGARPAVKFSVSNIGTNSTGPWNFLAMIPTISGNVFNSPIEQSLNPGDHIVFTLGFNLAAPGPAQPITVVADPNNQISESNEGNNSAAAAVTITATGR